MNGSGLMPSSEGSPGRPAVSSSGDGFLGGDGGRGAEGRAAGRVPWAQPACDARWVEQAHARRRLSCERVQGRRANAARQRWHLAGNF
jgi:hypothetical protein